MAAGKDDGLRPFGVEAQRVLRLEKGFAIVGQDTDALSDPVAAGMGSLIKADKADFVGRDAALAALADGARARGRSSRGSRRAGPSCRRKAPRSSVTAAPSGA